MKYPVDIRGIETRQNKNKAFVVRVHYTADPDKDPERDGKEWFEEHISRDPKTGLPDARWEQEMEINADACKGRRAYDHFLKELYPRGNLFDEITLNQIYGTHGRTSRDLLWNQEKCFTLDTAGGGANSLHGALWSAVDKEKKFIFVYDEYYEDDSIVREHANRIIEREKNVYPIKTRIIDTAAYSKEAVSGTSAGEEYEKYLRCRFRKATKNREDGMSRVNEYFEDKILLIHKDLYYFFWEIERYLKDVKRDDHLMDCVRYLCMEYDLHRTKGRVRVYKH